MPVYEYTCRKCHRRFEIFQKISDKPKKTCMECGGTMEKMVSQSSFQLKGTGWYATDYAKKTSQKEAKSPEPKKQKKQPSPSSSATSGPHV